MPSKKKTAPKPKTRKPAPRKKAATARKTSTRAKKRPTPSTKREEPTGREVIAVRTQKVRKNSRAIASGSIRVKPGLDVPKPSDLARALDVEPAEAKRVLGKIEELAKWIHADKRRSKAFGEAPVRILAEREPRLAGQIRLLHPKLIEALLGLFVPGCDNLPKPSEYAECVRNILTRVAEWMQASSANRAVFKNDTDAAVDSAAPFAPAVAKMLAKQALRTATTVQGGAA